MLLCEDVLVTDTLLILLQVVAGPSPLDSVHYAKLEGPRCVRDDRGCPEEHWDKTLMLTITGQRPGTEEKGQSKWSWIHLELQGTSSLLNRRLKVSKVDLLGM